MEGGKIYTSGMGCTNFFASPEMLESKSIYDGIMADVWAAGVTLYQMVYGKYPFYSPNVLEVFDLIKTQELKFEEQEGPEASWKNNPLLKNFITKMLDRNVESRWRIEELLKHDWLTK